MVSRWIKKRSKIELEKPVVPITTVFGVNLEYIKCLNW